MILEAIDGAVRRNSMEAVVEVIKKALIESTAEAVNYRSINVDKRAIFAKNSYFEI